ncbi:serine protease inhibitor 88Ea-like isoform X2 [Homalodisca vitripennis]|uniref:serine protease inhibitor 88Ea-like isoform X2 n=1 Tax=Homalodisca vitripennis TaxID=197043 RepID=UPI001EEC906B|nr:serine protease inhibitor 88Ea-like isoform X2 [Homalodisca vitripennis]
MIHLLVIASLAAPLSVVAQKCPLSIQYGRYNEMYTLVDGREELAVDLIRSVASQYPTQNVLLSPDSIFWAFQLLFFASSGYSEEILRKFLHIPHNLTKNDVVGFYDLKGDHYPWNQHPINAYELDSVNKMYIQQGFGIRDCVKHIFSTEYSTADFKNELEYTRKNINKWIEMQTRNMIVDCIPEGFLDKSTSLLLVNAVYFKGLWKSRFNKDKTSHEDFYMADGSTRQAEMMKQRSIFRAVFSSSYGIHGLELPYKGDDISMFIILPEQSHATAVQDLLRSLTFERQEKILSEILESPMKEMDVIIPKFKTENKYDLVPVLKDFGADELLEFVDLSDLVEKFNEFKLDKAIHTAKIVVDEQGTEAVAVTKLMSVSVKMFSERRGNISSISSK